MIESVDVLGLGNSLVDIIAETDDAYLLAQDMVKGAMTLIDEERAEALYAARVAPRVVSGGSAANTVVGVASFGVSSAYIGKVKADDLGRAFIADLRAHRRRFRHRSRRRRSGDRTLPRSTSRPTASGR